MDLLNDLKSNMYEKHPSTKGYIESVSFQYAKVIFVKRMELNLTQKELAEKAGVSLKTIKIAETGSKNLTIESFEKIFNALNITIQDVSKVIIEINEAGEQPVATK